MQMQVAIYKLHQIFYLIRGNTHDDTFIATILGVSISIGHGKYIDLFLLLV